MIRILFADREAWPGYEAPLAAALDALGVAAAVRQDFSPKVVDYIVTSPAGWIRDFTPYRQAKAVLNLWAGVEGIVGNATLTQPLVRMVEPGLVEGMVEWVTGHVLRHHLGTDAQVLRQDGSWQPVFPPLARDRKVGVMGLGELGRACAEALAALRFDVAGWSRRSRAVPGILCLSGEAGFREILARSEILVLLLPLTAGTECIIDADALARMPEGAVILNPGRGALIDDAALLAALDAGRIGHATLDVFRTEPLPPGHPFWAHPKVTVTPHVAAATRVGTASRALADNIRRGEAGEAFVGLVDRAAGY